MSVPQTFAYEPVMVPGPQSVDNAMMDKPESLKVPRHHFIHPSEPVFNRLPTSWPPGHLLPTPHGPQYFHMAPSYGTKHHFGHSSSSPFVDKAQLETRKAENVEDLLAALPSRRRKRARKATPSIVPPVATQSTTTKSTDISVPDPKKRKKAVKKGDKKSRFRGVFWHSRSKSWVASIMANGKASHLGYYDDEIEAALTYDDAARKLRGPLAVVNFSEKESLLHKRALKDTKSSRHSKKCPERTSIYRGVCWNKCNKSWKACMKIAGKNTHIGYFDDEVDAAKAYDIKALQIRGDKARTNFPVT